MVSKFCASCRRATLHYFLRLSGMWECDDCGHEHPEDTAS